MSNSEQHSNMDPEAAYAGLNAQERSTLAMPVYTIEAAIADALDRLEGRPHRTSRNGGEHWIWTGTRLVRASPQASERLRLLEIAERAELERLHQLQAARRRQQWQAYRRLVGRLVSPLRSLIERWRS